MNLFDILSHSGQIGENYFLHNTQVDDSVLEKNAILATIVPSVADCAAIMSMAKSFSGSENIFENQKIISETMSTCVQSKNDGDIEKIKFIQELILATINHADFSTKYKSFFKSKSKRSPYSFYHLVPALGYSAIKGIINNKNYLPIYEAIGKMMDKCDSVKKEAGFVIADHTWNVDINILSPQLFATNFVKYHLNNKFWNASTIKFNDVKKIEINKDVFKKYIEHVNYVLSINDSFFGPDLD